MNHSDKEGSSNCIHEEDEDESRLENLKGLPRQGQMMKIATPEAASTWVKSIQSLAQHVFKFALNVTHDIPHNQNANLHLWKKRSSSTCPLCHQPNQNLIHVMNNWKVALDFQRYDDRHNRAMTNIIRSSALLHLYDCGSVRGYTHIAATDLRLDIVWWNDDQNTLTLVELTVCFETSYEAAITRKEDQYHDPIAETQNARYTSTLITVEVGSRGLSGFQRLCDILKPRRPEFCKLLLDTSQQAILGSYKIWCSRNNTFTWPLFLASTHAYVFLCVIISMQLFVDVGPKLFWSPQ